MRNLTHLISLFLFIILALSACGHQHGQNAATIPQTKIAKPTNPNDAAAWETYLVKVSKVNLQGAVNKPYLFLVPSGSDPTSQDRRRQTQDALSGMAARNMFPGNTIVVSGPDSAVTADVLIAAFGKAKPDSLRGLIVLYVGDDSEKSRAEKPIAASGAAFRYAKM